MLIQASGQNLPRKRKGWTIAALLGALLGALIFAGGVLSTALQMDHEYRVGGMYFADLTVERDSEPMIGDFIAPHGIHYHDLGQLDANYWTWRIGRRYCRFPH